MMRGLAIACGWLLVGATLAYCASRVLTAAAQVAAGL